MEGVGASGGDLAGGGVRPRLGDRGPVLSRWLEQAAAIEPIGGGHSGAVIERLRLAGGGSVVVKLLDPTNDWQMRATQDDGREARLFAEGVFERLGGRIGHAVLDVERCGDGWVVIARDVGADLLGWPVDRALWRRYLDALGAMHAAVGDVGRTGGAATVLQRWGLWWPDSLAAVADLQAAQPTWIARGWELLDDAAPPDVAATVRSIVSDPHGLLDVLRASAPAWTLLHGDAHAANVAVSAGGAVTLLDWGLATVGPPAVEAAWLANFSQHFAFSLDDLLADIRELWAPRLDPHGRDLDAALAAQASSVIPALLPAVVDGADPLDARRSTAKLDWWIRTLRRSVERLSGA